MDYFLPHWRTTCTNSMSQNCWNCKYMFVLPKINSAQQGLTNHHKCTLFSLNNVNVTPDIPCGSVCLNSAPTGPGYNWNDRSDCSAGNETWIFQLTALRWMAEISWNDGTVSWRRKRLRLSVQISRNITRFLWDIQARCFYIFSYHNSMGTLMFISFYGQRWLLRAQLLELFFLIEWRPYWLIELRN